jgi:hypothetical protein
MNADEIIAHRLLNQQIAETKLKKPAALVSYMMAMQAQEYAQAKWAIGLRIPGLTDANVEKDFNDGKLIRTHILRPTWHWVSPADIRWMMVLSSPRVHAFNKTYYKKTELDTKTVNKCMNILVRELEGNNFQTRKALSEQFKKAKINTDALRLSLIMMHAELEGIVCSGPRQGKQFTYRLLNELVPPAKPAPKEELLADFTYKYFNTRGPATLQDFAWWSGLSMTEVKEGIALVEKKLDSFMLNEQQYWFKPKKLKNISKLQHTFLMPDYDEYGISYKDRELIFTGKNTHPSNSAFYHSIVMDGIVIGSWKAIGKRENVSVNTHYTKPLNKTKERIVNNAINKYLTFIDK